MHVNRRREPRSANAADYSICWRDEAGLMRSFHVRGADLSNSGACVRVPVQLPVGHSVFIEGPDGRPTGYSVVRHCTPRQDEYHIGLEFTAEARSTLPGPATEDDVDYYEFLQISPKAEFATIQRVYRYLAGRFHTDNPETGDAEKFILLHHAYEVLSDPEKRAKYDLSREGRDVQKNPIFDQHEFVIGVEGEMNRRLGVLSLLYHRRRTNPENPRVPLQELEQRMGWPREYLDFTTWYLRSKLYITREDNSDFALTAAGVDYVEQNYSQIPILERLLNAGGPTATGEGSHGKSKTDEKLYLTAASRSSQEPGASD